MATISQLIEGLTARPVSASDCPSRGVRSRIALALREQNEPSEQGSSSGIRAPPHARLLRIKRPRPVVSSTRQGLTGIPTCIGAQP